MLIDEAHDDNSFDCISAKVVTLVAASQSHCRAECLDASSRNKNCKHSLCHLCETGVLIFMLFPEVQDVFLVVSRNSGKVPDKGRKVACLLAVLLLCKNKVLEVNVFNHEIAISTFCIILQRDVIVRRILVAETCIVCVEVISSK